MPSAQCQQKGGPHGVGRSPAPARVTPQLCTGSAAGLEGQMVLRGPHQGPILPAPSLE